jgi:crossover junction endodeoxyribonuclease RusA
MNGLSIFVAGEPAPQGSKRHVGGGVLVESCKRVKPWRQDVRAACLDSAGKPKVQFGDSAVIARLEFVMPRPKSAPKKSTPAAIRKPDLDKLTRAVFDAIGSAQVWTDDARCVGVVATKRLAEPDEASGCHIELVAVAPGIPVNMAI